MSRLGFLIAALIVFVVAAQACRAGLIPPRWRTGLAALTTAGTFLATVSLLSAILLPEVLIVRSIGELWHTCSVAFETIWEHPLGRLPSIVAGVALALVLGRFAWGLVISVRVTRRARVSSTSGTSTASRYRVHVLPVDIAEAYSVPGRRGQVILTRGLLQLLDEDERRAVLLHEEGHLHARHHGILTLAKAAAFAVSPVVPSSWLLTGLEQALEEAADEYAARRIGSPIPVATGLSKAALAGLYRPARALAMAAGPNVPARVQRLLEPPRVPAWIPILAFDALFGLFVILVATQVIAGFAVIAAAHHLLGIGAATTCPLFR